ncbi:MAG TPA: carbon-nitrogen family hydrolase, partial [Planctomycetota bacterium]|nr:carbon-nitrogen family hydrolase [Planctomycetota bacterium]
MHAALVQLDLVWEDKAANHARVRSLVERSGVPRGSLLVLPEMFSTGFSMRAEAIAEPAGGPTEQFLASLAREFGLAVVGGVVTLGPDGRGRNQALAIGPDGRALGRYSKIHPFSFGEETRHYTGGSEIVLFDHGGFKVAPFVCYDLRFPEVFRAAVVRGAELYVVIANWPEPREAHWRALLQARAIENQAYVVGVNRTGRDPKLAYGGRSQVIGPKGEILADLGSREGVTVIEIDRAPLEEWRRVFP